MSTVEQERSLYRRTLKESLVVRRYTGPANSRTAHDYACRGRVFGDRPVELIGSANQYDYKAIVFAQDLVDLGFSFPITSADKLVYRGKELSITFPDMATRSAGDTTIAYELMVRG